MKLALVQMNYVPGDLKGNLKRIKKEIAVIEMLLGFNLRERLINKLGCKL